MASSKSPCINLAGATRLTDITNPLYLPHTVASGIELGARTFRDFMLHKAFISQTTASDECCICLEPMLPPPMPTLANRMDFLIGNKLCGHVLHALCLDDMVARATGNYGACPLCRSSWFQTEEEHRLIQDTRTILQALQSGGIRTTGYTDLKVGIFAQDLTYYIQIAGYNAVRSGNHFATTSDSAHAIFDGWLTSARDLNNQT
ncbi:hypothetical protein LTR08_003651 [Meristemomyces frigidus]|nr:hypothetical protein LTR08_003651 [Meristemomyces frigidus]